MCIRGNSMFLARYGYLSQILWMHMSTHLTRFLWMRMSTHLACILWMRMSTHLARILWTRMSTHLARISISNTCCIDRNCDVLRLLFDDLIKYNINVSFTLKSKIKSQTAQIEFHKFSEILASGVEVV